jgi:hypothetical protein
MVGDDSIVFLGHPAVVAAETSFDVNERDLPGIGSKGGSERGVRVPLHDHRGWPVDLEVPIQQSCGFRDLAAAPATADRQMNRGSRETEVGEENVREVRIVVLSGVYEACSRSEKADDLG